MLDDFCTKFIQLSYCEKKSLKYILVFLVIKQNLVLCIFKMHSNAHSNILATKKLFISSYP